MENDVRVQELIDKDTRWWNVSLIHEIFHAKEAERIRSLALSPYKQTDQQIWIGTSKGGFSVKSAYHMAKSHFVQTVDESITTEACSRAWKLNVPSLVRVSL